MFNDLDGLKRTRESIFKQESSDFEWVVIDGGSGDETTNYLESLGRDLRWISGPDKGIYDAMNRGVSLSMGDYVLFMNAGDTFYDRMTLTKITKKLLSEERGADILFGGAMLSFPISGRFVYRPPRKVDTSLWHGLPAIHQATVYRRSLLVRTPYDLQYNLCGDYYLAAVLISIGAQAVYLDEPLAYFEVGGQSYYRRKSLFVEPYRIQRDVLKLDLHYRLISVAKRLISLLGFMALSLPILKGHKK